MAKEDVTNLAAEKEPAEGSRETILSNTERGDQDREQESDIERPMSGRSEDQVRHRGGSISNRPIDEERTDEVPPRGQTREEAEGRSRGEEEP